MQSPPKQTAAISLATENAEAAAMDSDCVSESDIEASIVGVKPTSSFHSDYSDSLPSLEIRYLRYFCIYLVKYKIIIHYSPQKQIQFTRNGNEVLSCVLKLTNQNDVHMAFKVKNIILFNNNI